MNYQEQVDTMLAHMAREYSHLQMLQLMQALGQGLAKAACLLPTANIRIEILSKVFVAVDNEAEILQRRFMGITPAVRNDQTIPVFMDGLRTGKVALNG